jgi:hypothetical protein
MANDTYNNAHNPTQKKPASIRLLLCYSLGFKLLDKAVLGFFRSALLLRYICKLATVAFRVNY